MEEKTFNEDYIRGIKFLLEVSKEQGVNVRKAQWIPHVSEMLSKHNVCYQFWYNVWYQKRLNRVPLCKTWYDVMFDIDKCLFTWDKSYEGHSFWVSMLRRVLGTRTSEYGSEYNGSNRLLCE